MPVQGRVAKDVKHGGVREGIGRDKFVYQILLMKIGHHAQPGNRIPSERDVRVKGVLGVIAGNQIRGSDWSKQVVGPRIVDVAVQGDVMSHRHGDLQRVGLRLMARQHAVNVVASRRIRDVLAGGDRTGGSVDVYRILQAVVKAAKLVLVDELQKIS